MIHHPERIKAGGTNGEGLLRLFTQMAEQAEAAGLEAGQLVVSFIDEKDDFKEGDWVCELWLCIQKVSDDQASE